MQNSREKGRDTCSNDKERRQRVQGESHGASQHGPMWVQKSRRRDASAGLHENDQRDGTRMSCPRDLTSVIVDAGRVR